MSRADFLAEMLDIRERLHANHLAVLEKLDTNHRELASAPAWPQARAGAAPWQDVYLCPPADGQSVWLRRSGEESTAFRAVFDRPGCVFTLGRGWQIRWYQIGRWRAG